MDALLDLPPTNCSCLGQGEEEEEALSVWPSLVKCLISKLITPCRAPGSVMSPLPVSVLFPGVSSAVLPALQPPWRSSRHPSRLSKDFAGTSCSQGSPHTSLLSLCSAGAPGPGHFRGRMVGRRERETHTETETQRDRQTGTETQRDRQTDTETQRE